VNYASTTNDEPDQSQGKLNYIDGCFTGHHRIKGLVAFGKNKLILQ